MIHVFYGGFLGGDPRDFTPDGECCIPAQIENHHRACTAWDEGGRDLPKFGHHRLATQIVEDGEIKELVGIASYQPFGIGTNSWDCGDDPECEFCAMEEAEEADEDDPIDPQVEGWSP